METKAKCLIVDDEPLAIEVLKSHLGKIDSIEIAGTAGDAIQAFGFLNRHKVDLMFLDIHMPEMKGTELIKSLRNPPAVILTTAHRQYALEGFELNVVDYLLKPISFERLLKAVQKFFSTFGQERGGGVSYGETPEEYLYLKEKNLVHKIPVSEIIFAESMGDNLSVHTESRVITTRCTLSSVEKLLVENGCIRIHRSYIVSKKKITSFSPVSVFIGKKEFPIGVSYRSVVYDQLDYRGLSDQPAW